MLPTSTVDLAPPLRWLYSGAGAVAAPVALWSLGRRARRLDAPGGWRQRLALELPAPGPYVWVHAVSVGEVVTAAPLVRGLLEAHPRVLVTTTTPTGAAQARRLFGSQVTVTYLPLDHPWAVRRFVARVQPRLCVLVEAELWPNLLATLRARETPTLLANARMSARSARWYRRVAPVAREMLGGLSGALARSEADAQRLRALGLAPERLEVAGCLKLDQPLDAATRARGEDLRRAWRRDRPCWVAGSVRGGEEEAVLDAHERVRSIHADALLVLAPRHVSRFEGVARACEARGLPVARHGRGESVGLGDAVTLCDTVGELRAAYGAGDVAFVGGSLVDAGGHNPAEVGVWGIPAVMGPSRHTHAEACAALTEVGALVEVADAGSLAAAVVHWLGDATARRAAGASGRDALATRGGALAHHLAACDALLRQGAQPLGGLQAEGPTG